MARKLTHDVNRGPHLVTCGRLHFGPCCVNGDLPDGTRGPVCMWCWKPVSLEQRAQIQRTWDTLKATIPGIGKDDLGR